MKNTIRKHYSILIFIVILVLSSNSLHAKVLSVPAIVQEMSQWCWAAVSESVLEYYGMDITQTEIADYGTGGVNTWNYLWSSTDTRKGIVYILDHFDGHTYNGFFDAIPLSDVTTIIDDDRPIIFRWGWDGGGGHFLVIHGVEGNNIHYMDPMFGYAVALYDWMVDGANHTWTDTCEITTPFDNLTCNGQDVTIMGTEGNDIIEGTDGPDVIHGLGGVDIIRGMGGNDTICGGDAADFLSGVDGNDMIFGEHGDDAIWGGPGDDIINGGDGHDSIKGGYGNDELNGGDGHDVLNGLAGNDIINGNYGNDTLYGGDGVDKLTGGWGPNSGTIDNNDSCYDTAGTFTRGCEVFYEQ